MSFNDLQEAASSLTASLFCTHSKAFWRKTTTMPRPRVSGAQNAVRANKMTMEQHTEAMLSGQLEHLCHPGYQNDESSCSPYSPSRMSNNTTPEHNKGISTTPETDLRLPFRMLRLVLDELSDRLKAEAAPLSETEEDKILEFASEFQQLSARNWRMKEAIWDVPDDPTVEFNPDAPFETSARTASKNSDSPSNNNVSRLEAQGAEHYGAQASGDAKKTVSTKKATASTAKSKETAVAATPSQVQALEKWQEQLVTLFRTLDADGSGSLSVDELRSALIEASIPMARLAKLIKIADADNDGEIDLDEWIRAITTSGAKEFQAISFNLSDKLRSGTLFQENHGCGCVLHPLAKVRITFDTTVFVICCYLALVSPFVAAWESSISSSATEVFEMIDFIIMIFFAIDIVLNFFTGYFNSNDEVVLSLRHIAQNYLKGWFPLDFLSTFPFDIIGIKGGKHMQVFKVLKLVKLLKIVKLLAPRQVDWSDYSQTMDNISTSKIVQMLHRRSAVLLNLLLVCHWMACGLKLVESKDRGFLQQYDDVYGDLAKEYLASLYWAMTTLTTVGYGDICPTSDGERVYTILAMVVGGGFYGYVVGSICSMVASSDLNSSAFYDRMELIHAWVNHHKLPLPIQRRLRRYFKIYLSEKSAINEAEIWRDLTPELQREVGEYIINREVCANPLFDGLAMGTVVRLQSILQKTSTPQGRVIVQKGEPGMAMYLLMSGSAQQVTQDAQGKEHITNLGIGQSWGEEILLGFYESYEYTVTTLQKCKMEMLLEDDFIGLFTHMPSVMERMRQNALELNPHWAQSQHRHS